MFNESKANFLIVKSLWSINAVVLYDLKILWATETIPLGAGLGVNRTGAGWNHLIFVLRRS